MKNERLLTALGNIDDELIENAISKKNRVPVMMKWVALAACVLGIIWVARPETENLKLPLITIPESIEEAMGFEAYWAYDISELISANPWNEDARIDTLPVYKNTLEFDEKLHVTGEDLEEMRLFMQEVAEKFEIEVEDSKIKTYDTEKFGGPTRIEIKEDGVKMIVDSKMKATITFEPGISLPENYDFSYWSSYEDMLSVARYLQHTYQNVLGLDDWQVNVEGGDYNIEQKQSYDISFSKKSEDITSQILNYNFNLIEFDCNPDGELYRIEINRIVLSEKIANYPIVSVKEAKKLLKEGSYFTNVPYEITKMKHVKDVELVYRTGEMEEYFLPYYRFLVELPEDVKGMKSFGAYYVPAVEQKFIQNVK